MRLLITLLIVGLSTFFMACGGEGASSTDTATTTATDAKPTTEAGLIAAVDAANKALNVGAQSASLDRKKANAVAKAYEDYLSAHPKGKNAAEYLFKSAEIYRSLRQFDKAVAAYQTINSNFTSYEKAPHSLFLLGFSYENDLKDTAKAKEVYEQFVKKYPDHELSDDVKFSLTHLGQSPEQIIEEFEKKKKK